MKKYPKRFGDCEYTMDCPWGMDGWCDRLKGEKCEIQKMDEAEEEQKNDKTRTENLENGKNRGE